jgi:hypothetical protein
MNAYNLFKGTSMMIKKHFAKLMSILICSLSITSSLQPRIQDTILSQPLQLLADAPKYVASLFPMQVSTIDIEFQKALEIKASAAIDSADGKPRKISWSEWFAKIGPAIKDHLYNQGSSYSAFVFLGVGLLCISQPAAFYENLSRPAILFKTIQQIPYASILQTCALQYTRYFLTTATHEGGHALANYLINGTIAEVYLGASKVADGVEILPHLILSGFFPLGVTDGIKNPMIKHDKEILNAANALYKKYNELYPNMTREKRADCKELQEELARINVLNKDFISRLKLTTILAAGVISALFANGVIKFIAGEPILSLDHYDIKQLLNLMPVSDFDGGQIMDTVFDRQDITQAGNDWCIFVILMALFLKACSENGCIQNIASATFQETAKKLIQACGFASLNFAGMGLAHASAENMLLTPAA